MEHTENPDFAWEQPDKVLHDLEEIKQEFAKWQALGARARIWKYDATFSQLGILLEKVDHPHNFSVTCRGTLSICGSLQWDNASFEVSHTSKAEIFEGVPVTTSWLVLRDAQAGFEVVCAQIFAASDVEPLYWAD